MIILRLADMQEADIRKNLKVTLINIAELPEGFLKITHELSNKMELLDEVFGPRSVKALHYLLPKLSDYDMSINPFPKLDAATLKKCRRYVRSLAYIITNYKEEAA